jgi:transposase InsO family protein
MIMPPSTVQLPIVVALAAELPQLAHGESTPRVQSAARAMGISVQTCWRWLRDAGFASGRKRRADAGTLKALTADQVRQMAAIKLAGARETGKVLPTLEMVRRIANANAAADADTGEVRHTTAHISTIARAMRTLGCHTDQLMRQSPAHSLRSLHPNHVWQVDVSTCVLFYLSNGGIEICDQAAFNKNKPSSFERVQELRVQRYLVVDHCTGAYYLHYLDGHETARNLLDFLIPAFHQRAGRPMYGVPKILMADPGSAQASGVFRSIERALDMQVIVHEAGNPRAKGAVESLHNHIEHGFEGRLHAQQVRDFAHLNALADIWSAAHQSSAVHSRHGQTRYAAWMRIKPSELRIAPGIEITRSLVMAEPVSRVVSGLLTITFAVPGHGQRTYSVAGVPGAAPKEKLFVVSSPYTLPDIDVLVSDAGGREIRHRLSPIVVDDWGFNERGAVIGDEFKRHADTWIDTERKTAQRAAWGSDDKREIAKTRKGRGGQRGVAFGGAVDTFADVRQVPVPSYLPVQGTAIDVQTPAAVESLMSATTACLRMQALLGDDWHPEHYSWLTTKFASGIGEQQFQQLATTWQAAVSGHSAAAASATGTHGKEGGPC